MKYSNLATGSVKIAKRQINRGRRLRVVFGVPITALVLFWGGQARAQCPQKCDDYTALGNGALSSVTSGADNTAVGFDALFSDTTGGFNTAVGFRALNLNTSSDNTAVGLDALQQNTSGSDNTAIGEAALGDNVTGIQNTAVGSGALVGGSGNNNTGVGWRASLLNFAGNNNTAVGSQALINSSGSSNIGIGESAGINLTSGKNNIDIGNAGTAGESAKIRIGNKGQKSTFIAGISGVSVPGGVGVIIDSDGHLGTVTSSKRYKEAIKPMNKASETILDLKPVTFRYKKDIDPQAIPQFGLVAEDVAKVDPNLVARDAEGKPYTVRYEAVNAMLLNEFLKEHRTVEQLKATATKQEEIIAKQASELEALTNSLQQVNNKLELIKSTTRVVAGN
jgi:hypothetical protein